MSTANAESTTRPLVMHQVDVTLHFTTSCFIEARTKADAGKKARRMVRQAIDGGDVDWEDFEWSLRVSNRATTQEMEVAPLGHPHD